MILGVPMKDARLMAALKLTSRSLTFMVGLCAAIFFEYKKGFPLRSLTQPLLNRELNLKLET